MPKKVLIALPPSMLEQVDHIAEVEHRTRSDLIRESLRRYIDNFKRSSAAYVQTATVKPADQATWPTINQHENGA